MKKFLIILLFLLVPSISFGAVPTYRYANWCDYCTHYDYTNMVEQGELLKGSIKETSLTIGLNKIIAIMILGYDLMSNNYNSDLKSYTKYKIRF